MMQKETEQKQRIPFTALGLIFGTAIGAAFSLLIGAAILWAGAGTGIGLVTGAAIDAKSKRKK